MNTEETYLSKQKAQELEKELTVLKNEKRKEIAEQLEYAKSLGDLSENAEYHEARENQAALEERILIVENMLKTATIVKEGAHKGGVTVGSTVTVVDQKSGEKEEWSLVGSEESDLLNHKISNESPLGHALMGKETGDEVEVVTPKGKVSYKITKVG